VLYCPQKRTYLVRKLKTFINTHLITSISKLWLSIIIWYIYIINKFIICNTINIFQTFALWCCVNFWHFKTLSFAYCLFWFQCKTNQNAIYDKGYLVCWCLLSALRYYFKWFLTFVAQSMIHVFACWSWIQTWNLKAIFLLQLTEIEN